MGSATNGFWAIVIALLVIAGAWVVIRAIWVALFGAAEKRATFTQKDAPDLFTKDGRLRDYRDPAP